METVYRWVSARGYRLLPHPEDSRPLFGVVKSSGVEGINEKYVLRFAHKEQLWYNSECR